MELRHLRYFIGVGEELNFGRAAKRLHIAQPPLSKQIQDLERELGYALFERLPRGVKLTAAGKLYLDDARRILKAVEDAERRAERVAQGKSGTLRIGIATAIAWNGLVAEAIQEFRRRQPDAELELHHLISILQIDAIQSGRLDVGFAAGLISLSDELTYWQFGHDRMMLAVPKGHSLAKRKQIRIKDLRNMPFVWFSRPGNPVLYDQIMRACYSGGMHTPRIVQEAAGTDAILGLVQCRVGVTWMNESARWRCPPGVEFVPVVDMNIRLPFNLVWKRDNSSPILRKFIAQVQAL